MERWYSDKEVISSVAAELKTTIFHGIEADILKMAHLTMEMSLKNFDFVVASIHFQDFL